MDKVKTYKSNGKLLLTAEYLVLQGALALAVPTRYGQSLQVTPNNPKELYWKSLDKNGKIWFETKIHLPILQSVASFNLIEELLVKILLQANNQNPKFLSDSQGYDVITYLDFDRDWGLGTSSTLINNIAQWAQIDAFELLQKTMGGSGYDIACAQNDNSILYQLTDRKPVVTKVNFFPSFHEQVYFIYLNKKQKSNREIANFRQLKQDFALEIIEISTLTDYLLKVEKLDDFDKLLQEHELVMSHVLQRQTVQQQLFKDYFGQIKSLGAWGGDFILATGNEDTPEYFRKKGYNTVLLYDEMVLR